MKIFLDTADIEEIKTVARWGVLDGVTTNPTLYAKVGGSYDEILQQVCKITPGPVSAEVVSDDVDGMLEEGRHFAKLAPNIVVKVAMSENGLEAISRFAEEGIKTNCTLIFTANQGLLAAKAGASLLSPFVGRLDDINQDGMIVIRELAEIVAIHELETEVLAASIRNPLHMTQAALAGAHVIRSWTGIDGKMPDLIPVIGRSRTTPNLIHAFGFSGHGFQLGPVVGEIIAELVTQGRSVSPLEPFSNDRFANASPASQPIDVGIEE
jgi:transaldolase